MADDHRHHQPALLRPQPRRPATLSLSTSSSTSHSPRMSQDFDHEGTFSSSSRDLNGLAAASQRRPLQPLTPTDQPESESSDPPQRSRSILNLTSSTLFGIYGAQSSPESRQSSTSLLQDSNDPMRTPWGNGAQTPRYDASRGAFPGPTKPTYSGNQPITVEGVAAKLEKNRAIHRRTIVPQTTFELVFISALRIVILAGMGVAYGAFITHLHDTQKLAPVRVRIERRNARYLAFWGGLAVLLGAALPYVDGLFRKEDDEQKTESPPRRSRSALAALGAEWNPLVRSVGAFVGIAFAIRKLPWQSPQQLSLTLAMVNPCMWYLVDRTKTGFLMSTFWALLGSSLLFSLVPGIIPQPHASAPPAMNLTSILHSQSPLEDIAAAQFGLKQIGGLEGLGVATWTGSVLFCSSVFFGNIGRRLWGDAFE